MRCTDRDSQRSPVKDRFQVVCSKHDDDQIHRQVRSQTRRKVRTPVELRAADRRSWIQSVRRSAIKAFFNYLIVVP